MSARRRDRWPLSGCAPAVLLGVLAAGCGEERNAVWLGTIDTLEGGALHIRNPAQGMWRGDAPWRLIEEWEVGTGAGEGPEAFADVADFDVDSRGRTYVLDRQAQEVRVFDRDGHYVRTVGRRGRGPGELAGATGIALDPTGRLWVLNQGNARYSVFDTSGALVKEPSRLMSGGVRVPEWYGVFDSSGTLHDVVYLLSPSGMRFAYASYDTTVGRFFDTIPGVGSVRAPIGWGMRRETRYGWWLGNAAAYRLYQTTFGGDTLRVVERPYDPIPLSQAEQDSASASPQARALREQVRRLPDDLQPPNYRPIFVAFVEDDEGYLWVMLSPPSGARGTPLDIFDPSGRYLGVVTAPYHLERPPPPVVRDGVLYALRKDELDVPYIVAMRIEGRD